MDLFLKNLPNNTDLLKKYEIDKKKCQQAGTKQLECEKLISKNIFREIPRYERYRIPLG